MPDTEIVARLENATKVFGTGRTELSALADVTVGFESAKMTAIMGPSGSGKSTLLHCQTGLDDLTGGSAYIGDIAVSSLSDKQRAALRRSTIALLFQAPQLVPTLSAKENITLPLDVDKAKVNTKFLDQVCNVFAIGDLLDERPDRLTVSEQQRVAIARALVSRAKIIFADEPTGDLDSSNATFVLARLREAVDVLGRTVVLTTHDAVTASHCDRVLYLRDGAIVDEAFSPSVDHVLYKVKELRL